MLAHPPRKRSTMVIRLASDAPARELRLIFAGVLGEPARHPVSTLRGPQRRRQAGLLLRSGLRAGAPGSGSKTDTGTGGAASESDTGAPPGHGDVLRPRRLDRALRA